MMRTLKNIVLVIVLGIIAVPVGCFGSAVVYEAWNTYTHRYRLTVEVETPEGVKSSASVIEVSIQEKASWFPQAGGVGTSVRGEAVFVDLGNGRHVIATLGFGPHGIEDRVAWLATQTLGPTHASAQARARGELWRDVSSWKGSADVSPANIPIFVTFSDLNDPKTARVLRPNEFEQVFGPGVRFKRAWVEIVSAGIWPLNHFGITGQPLTQGIEQKLPWVRTHTGTLGDGFDLTWSRPSLNLSASEFIKRQ